MIQPPRPKTAPGELRPATFRLVGAAGRGVRSDPRLPQELPAVAAVYAVALALLVYDLLGRTLVPS